MKYLFQFASYLCNPLLIPARACLPVGRVGRDVIRDFCTFSEISQKKT